MDPGAPGSPGPQNPTVPESTPGGATSPAPESPGLLRSLGLFVDGVVGSVHDRVELLALELHEEKQRLVRTFAWTTAFVVSAMIATVFVSATIVVAFWNTQARLAVVAAVALAHVVAAVVIGLKLRRMIRQQPTPFAATLEELKTDRECLLPKN